MIGNVFTDEIVEQIADEIVFLIKEKQEFDELVGDVAREIAEKIGESPTNDEKLRERKWQIFIRRQSPYEKKFITKLKELFGKQEAEVLANMKQLPKSVKKGWEEDWLFNEKLWVERFGKEGRPFIGGVMESVGTSTLADLVVGIDFDVTNPRVVEFLDHYTPKFSFETNKRTMAELKKTLREGLAEGESIPKLRKRVNKVFNFAEKYRSTRIARTETIRASSAGAEEAYIQSGVVEGKEWLTAFDERTCPECMEMDGKKAGLGKSFDTGKLDVDLDYTEGEMPHSPLHVNCRCTIVPILIE